MASDGYIISGTRIQLPDVPAGFMRADSAGTIVKADTAAFVAEIDNLAGQPNGVASLDENGQVPLSQLGNAPGGGGGDFVPPTDKGVIITGDGSHSVTLAAGANKTALIADPTRSEGIKWAAYDHVDLLNKGTNTHAQIDTTLSLSVSDVTQGNIMAQVSAVTSVTATSGNWLLWLAYSCDLGGVSGTTAQTVLANRVGGSFTSGSAALTTANGVASVKLMVTQTTDTTWHATIYGNAASKLVPL